jgi:hypothetical protein
MKQLSGKTILLFCPRFFGYEKEIKLALENLGAKVIWFDDRPSNTFLSKVIIRVNKKLIGRKITKYYKGILNEMCGKKIDYLFFVNPESISFKSLLAIKNAFPDAKSVLYMWDSFNNRRYNTELLSLFDDKYTFDPSDASRYGMKFRPLFYIDTYKQKANAIIKKYELLFVGTAHSDRYNYTRKMLKDNDLKNTKMYFFLNSKAVFFFRKYINLSLAKVKYKDISFRYLTHEDIAKLMEQSTAVLDINHPRQIGLTIRTFEALGAQRKLVTTNKSIVNYDFYDKSNILIIDRYRPIMDLEFFNLPFKKSGDEILFNYSIQGWITEIFQLR